MYKMTDEEFYEIYGRMPRRTKKKKIKIYWHRIIIALIILILLIIGIVKLIQFIVGKVKGGSEDKDTSSVSSEVDDYIDPDAETENKENDADYSGVELTVCIDAAHGGFDKGTENENSRYEKDDTISIAYVLKQYLESCGVNVVMTRTEDVFMDVDDRCSFANGQNADIVISIHRGGTEIAGSDVQGFDAWIHSSEPGVDKAFAEKIMSKLEEIGISENKGVHTGYPGDSSINYQINDQTQMPSVLINMGYVTNSIDNQLLDANLEAYGRAIGNAVIETATELAIIDGNGARLKEGQLLSDKTAAIAAPEENEEYQPDGNTEDLIVTDDIEEDPEFTE